MFEDHCAILNEFILRVLFFKHWDTQSSENVIQDRLILIGPLKW